MLFLLKLKKEYNCKNSHEQLALKYSSSPVNEYNCHAFFFFIFSVLPNHQRNDRRYLLPGSRR